MFLIVVRIIPGLGGTIATQTAAALRVPIWRQIYTMSRSRFPFAPRSPSAETRSANYVDAHVFEPATALARTHHMHFLPRRSSRPHPSPSKRPRAVKVDSSPIRAALASLCARIVARSGIALDTEFHTEKHFTPS